MCTFVEQLWMGLLLRPPDIDHIAIDDLRDFGQRIVQVMRDAREGLDAIDPAVAQMAEVITAIDRGETDDWRGTLGRSLIGLVTSIISDLTYTLVDPRIDFERRDV